MTLAAQTVWEIRTGGHQNNSGGFRWVGLVNSTYRWTLSAGGTNEYYCELAVGGNPGLTEPHCCYLDGNHNLATNGTVGSLAAGEWDWGNNDALGFNTVYVRLSNGLDPDVMLSLYGCMSYVGIGFGGGYDYSQQDAAQLSLADLATPGAASTTLTSVIGGFTALMVGNIIHITSGNNFTVGWYEITAYTNGNTVTLDRSPSPAGAGANGVGRVGGAYLLNGALGYEFMDAHIGGNTLYIGPGNHSITEEILQPPASISITLVYRTLGYQTTRGDIPKKANRPQIDCGAFKWRASPTYALIANLRFTGTAQNVLQVEAGSYFQMYNVAVTNTAAAADKRAVYGSAANSVTAIACQFKSAGTSGTSYGILCATFLKLVGCYIKDCFIGAECAQSTTVLYCVISKCSTGVKTTGVQPIIVGNTFYDCTKAMQTTPGGSSLDLIVNNIFEDCDTILDNNNQGALYFHNCVHGHTAFATNDPKFYAGNIWGDPGLRDPANEDFRVDHLDVNVYEQAAEAAKFTDAIL